jgi:cell division septal protein FtsQ
MLRFLKRKDSKKRSVLEKQRVSKKGAKNSFSGHAFSWSLAAKSLLIVLSIVLVSALCIRAFDKAKDLASYVNSLIVLSPKDWRIEVVSGGGSPLPEDVKREVYKVAGRSLKTGSAEDLQRLAKQVESLGMVDGVRVVRPLADTVLLSAELRRPALLVGVGNKTRFMTLDGTVFGDSSDNTGNPSAANPGVIVTGVFDHRPNPGVDDSMRVITSAEERRHLLDALEVWQRSNESGVETRQISFQKFRGYSISLADGTEVVLGIKPFDYKLKKLRGILDGLKKDGITAARIELDYEGKAFIKERKL